MIKKAVKGLTAAFAAALLGAAAVYGSFSDSVRVDNHFSVGDVNIELEEFQKKGSILVPYKKNQTILPGERLSKIPRITNYADPCWIRARIDYKNNNQKLEGFCDSMISGISPEWVKRGEYYYYTKVLKQRESVDLFRNVRIPNTWTEAHSGQELGILIEAEAIQAPNFTPDFSGMSPWGNQKIMACVHEKGKASSCPSPVQKLSVEFHGEAHKLLAVPGDFFNNLGRAMPGDEFEDTVEVSNTTDQDAEIFFRTQVNSKKKEDRELLKEVGLWIYMDGKPLYQGTLDSPQLSEGHSLGVFSPSKSGRLKFRLSVPKEWDNSYALRQAEVQWIFSVKEEDTKETEQGQEKIPQNTKTEAYMAEEKPAVKTGDESAVEAGVLFLVCSSVAVLGILAVLICRKGGQSP